MGWLDRFRSSGEDLDEPEENGNEISPGAMGAIQKNNIGGGSTKTDYVYRMPSADMAQEYRKISDLTQLDQITLDNVLSCLVERFYSKEYYTFAGSVLISLNPCLNVSKTQLLEMECMTIMRKYKMDLNMGAVADEEILPPHVYSVGLRSLKNLRTVRSNQIIIVSGDSGAGKTTSTQQLIRYFTETNLRDIHSSKNIHNLEKKIYFATVVLESFGNASTVANPNSSRFGRLVQLTYDNQSRISGAEMKTYLLEKHRVAKGSSSERNFHIFYFLLKGLEMGRFKIEDISKEWTEDYDGDLLNDLTEGIRESDAEDMLQFFQALKVLNMAEEFQEVFRLVFAIMQLRTVKFILKGIEDSDSCSNSDDSPCPSDTEFTVKDWDPIDIACSILGKDNSSLLDAFIARTITAGGGDFRRPSIFRTPCDREAECDERLQAFIILLYDKLFNYILNKMNNLLQATATSKDCMSLAPRQDLGGGDNINCQEKFRPCTKLSLLDLYGFENLEYNHLEQMCINYANERLQQVHISALKNCLENDVNLSEIEIQFEEPWELNRVEIEIRNRVEELDIHLFSLLNEEYKLKRCSTDKAIFERMIQASKADEFISCGRLHENECPFIVRHYAADVTYHFRGMPEKNKDYIPHEFEDLLSSSTNDLVRSLFQSNNQSSEKHSTPSKTPKNKTKERGKTILKRFKSSVDELVNELEDENQDLHFIRCIRPNTDLQQGIVQPQIVKDQLYSCGIVDVIRIAGNGYPIRIRHSKFGEQFPIILRYLCGRRINPKILSLVFCFDKSLVKVGSSAIFMNEKSWSLMEKFEKLMAHSSAKKLQSWFRLLIITQRQKVKTPSPKPHFGDSMSSDETIWFTPSMTLTDSSMSAIPGPFGDWRNKDDSFLSYTEVSLNSSWKEDSMDIVDNDKTLTDSHNRDRSEEMLSNSFIETKELISKLHVSPPIPQNLYFVNGIMSRSPVHSLPIKLYTKKTALGNSFRPPQRLVANGLQDAFADYKICMTEHNCFYNL